MMIAFSTYPSPNSNGSGHDGISWFITGSVGMLENHVEPMYV